MNTWKLIHILEKGFLKDYELFTIFIDFKWNLLLCSGSLMVE